LFQGSQKTIKTNKIMNQLFVPRFGVNKMASLLLKYNYKVKLGDILAGRVIGKEKTQNLIDLGLEKASFFPHQEFGVFRQKETSQALNVHEIGEFIVIDYNLFSQKTVVSFRYLHYLRVWERFRQLDVKNMILSSYQIQSYRSGKLVCFDDLTLFVPNAHLPKYYKRKKEKGNYLPLKILEVHSKKRIVASCKLAFLKKQSLSLHLGLVEDAYVLSIQVFGIFLNVYGIKCLLHISEISHQKIENKNIKAYYKKGDKIKVKVIYINSSQGKIAVSAK